jgi:GNAT superfamily N-acetyltransferase
LLKIEKVDEAVFKNIPSPCRYCLYWQTRGAFDENKLKPEMELEKQEWFNAVSKRADGYMMVAYLDSVPIGFVQCAQPRFFPRTEEYAAGPPTEDAAFLACLYVINKENRGRGMGTAMLKNLITELKKTDVRAVETFARKSSADNPSGPLELYLKHNFTIRNDKDDFPLVRLEL